MHLLYLPMKRKKDSFVYLVSCNKEPIVYGIYKSKHHAVRYACDLIRYRKQKAKNQGKEFGYYHFKPLPQNCQLRRMKEKGGLYYYDMILFSACLCIPEEKNVSWGDDGCLITVQRRILH